MRPSAVLFLPLFLASVAHGQTTPSAQEALAEVAKCADVTDGVDRLKCYDRAAAMAKSALAAAPKVAAEKKSWLDWFGFSKPPSPPQTTEEFGKGAPPAPQGEVTQVTSNVLEFAKTSRGEAVFILENGQIWRQLSGDSTNVKDPPPGTTMRVTIENGVFGSYNLIVEGRNTMVKVTRLK